MKSFSVLLIAIHVLPRTANGSPCKTCRRSALACELTAYGGLCEECATEACRVAKLGQAGHDRILEMVMIREGLLHVVAVCGVEERRLS
jgi:hypothetical protein